MGTAGCKQLLEENAKKLLNLEGIVVNMLEMINVSYAYKSKKEIVHVLDKVTYRFEIGRNVWNIWPVRFRKRQRAYRYLPV